MKIFLFPFLFLLLSCAGPAKQDEDFYFPVKNFMTEKTYCFVNRNDTSERSYWKMKTTILNNDTLFRTSIFDSRNRISETMTEKVVNGNSKIGSYTLFDYDQQGNVHTTECKIIDSVVFKTGQKIDEQIQWKVSFKEYNSTRICELSKKRTLQSQGTDQKTFSDLMQFIVVGTNEGYSYSMTSTYQKGKGLVSYKLIMPDGKVKDFILTSVE